MSGEGEWIGMVRCLTIKDPTLITVLDGARQRYEAAAVMSEGPGATTEVLFSTAQQEQIEQLAVMQKIGLGAAAKQFIAEGFDVQGPNGTTIVMRLNIKSTDEGGEL